MSGSEYWSLIPEKRTYQRTQQEGFSVFPAIVNPHDKTVFCRRCHRWEYILHFNKNTLITQCGTVYKNLFAQNNSVLNYGFSLKREKNSYIINVSSQFVSTEKRRLFFNEFILDLENKRLYRNGEAVFSSKDTGNFLINESTTLIAEEMGDKYKKVFGIKPTVASKLNGFSLLIGYMLSPFNINFYQIAKHWGLNPYDKEFAELSSGNSPTAENEMFENLDIKPTKTIRKMYQKNPQSVVCYAAAKDMGFSDVNILQKSYSAKFYLFLNANMISFAGGYTTYGCQEGLKQFVEDLLHITNQKTAWNSIERTVEYFTQKRNNETIVTDGINSYIQCREELTDNEKREIMREGFNQYTHDFLVRRVNELIVNDTDFNFFAGPSAPDVTFEIEQKFLDLEYKTGENHKKIINLKTNKEEYVPVSDEDRYCFYVARDSKTLRTVGSEMHNCVGWCYPKSVEKRHCTIVYAMYKGKYRICIEVTPDFKIRQSLGPCNQPLKGDDLNAYAEWYHEKNISFTRAFMVRMAV